MSARIGLQCPTILVIAILLKEILVIVLVGIILILTLIPPVHRLTNGGDLLRRLAKPPSVSHELGDNRPEWGITRDRSQAIPARHRSAIPTLGLG